MARADHQIAINPADTPKTTAIMPFGLSEFLRNMAQISQRFIDSVKRELSGVDDYLNDILVASKSRQEHLTRLSSLFLRLEAHGVTMNGDKSEFSEDFVDFFGQRFSSQRFAPLGDKVEAIKTFPQKTPQRKSADS